MPITHSHPLHPHPHYNHLRSSSPSRSPTHSPKSIKRRSLPMDDEFPFAYDFPQYTYVPPPSPVLDPLFLSTSSSGPSSSSGSSAARSKSSVTNNSSQPIASGSAARDQVPPPSSARVFNNHTHYPGTAPISSSSGFTSDGNRARGPSFASTTSYTSSSTTSSGSSSGAPATPPRSSHLLTLGSPSSSRVLRPYWERSHPLAGDEEEDRLDEGPEDELREKEARRDVLEVDVNDVEEDSSDEEFGYDTHGNSTDAEYARYMAYLAPSLSSALSGQPQLPRRPPSARRSPFADDDPSQPQNISHIYLDDDITPTGVRRSSGSFRRRMTDSPRSVARSSSLTRGHGRASPRRLSSPIVMNSLSRIGGGSGSGSRPQSPALFHSPSNSSTHSPAHSTLPFNSNVRGHSPSPLHLTLPVRDISNSPSLNAPEPSPDVDASPLRTALLLNSGADFSLTCTSSGQPYEERARDKRFSGRGLGLNGLEYGGGSDSLELQGLGGDPGAINAALARRRAEWTEFEGDEYSTSGYEGRTTSAARPHAPLASSHLRNEEEGGVDLVSRSSRYGYGQGGLNLNLNDDSGEAQDEEVQGAEKNERRANVDLSSPRPSLTFTRPHPYARVYSPIEKRRSVSQPRGGISYTYAYGFEPDHTDDERHSLHADRPSTSGQQSANHDNNEKGPGEKGDGEDGVPTCFAIQWRLRARWAALKLSVRLGAFRAKRRVGLA